MKKIGLTGGIASGKTQVSNYLIGLGATVLDADAISRALTAPAGVALAPIRARFGSDVFLVDGTLNRAALADVVFQNPEKRKELNAIIHPLVFEELSRCLAAAKQKGLKRIVLDVPLLFESGYDKMVDEIWIVYATLDQQIRRLIARDALTPSQAQARLASQMTFEEKRAHAPGAKVIDNSRNLEETYRQVKRLWEAAHD